MYRPVQEETEKNELHFPFFWSQKMGPSQTKLDFHVKLFEFNFEKESYPA